jgi:hypothetical protein
MTAARSPGHDENGAVGKLARRPELSEYATG